MMLGYILGLLAGGLFSWLVDYSFGDAMVAILAFGFSGAVIQELLS